MRLLWELKTVPRKVKGDFDRNSENFEGDLEEG